MKSSQGYGIFFSKTQFFKLCELFPLLHTYPEFNLQNYFSTTNKA